MTSRDSTSLEQMRQFYEIFPYPNRSLLVSPNVFGSLCTHAGFSQLVAKSEYSAANEIWTIYRNPSATFGSDRVKQYFLSLESRFPESNRILLVGCGTDEPLLFRMLHPKNEIVGIDLSKKTLRRAALKLKIYRAREIIQSLLRLRMPPKNGHSTLLQGDAEVLLRFGALSEFHHIQCFGVLHHQPHPEPLFKAMAKALAPGGTMRVMIYSHKGRRLERRIQNRYTGLWQNLDMKSYKARIAVRKEHFKLVLWQFYSLFFRPTSTGMRFRYLGLNSASVADALLHPSDPGLSIRSLEAWAKQCGLSVIFCEGKIDNGGWIAGFENPQPVWSRLAAVDETEGLVSNFIAIFKKES